MLRGECVRKRCSDGDEGNGGDSRGHANDTAHERRDVCYYGGHKSDEDQSNNEAGPAAQDMRRRAQGEQDFPSNGQEVQASLARGDVDDLAVLSLGRVEHDRFLDLLPPCCLFFFSNFVK